MIEENKSAFDDFEKDYNPINPKELFYSIWNKPKLTLKHVLKHQPEKYVFVLLALGGIVRSISRASNKNLGDTMSTFSVLAIAIIVGGLLGWISYYIYAWALSATGFWIDGEAEPSNFRTVIAWSLVPSITSLVLLIPEVIIFGDDLFRSELQDDSMFSVICLIVFGVLEIILGIWSLVILVIGIKLIQGFSTGKAILNLILPILVIIVPLLIIIYIIS